MVRFKFFVNCSGWSSGGYENIHFAKSKAEAKRIIKSWNEKDHGRVKLLSIEEISDKEFAEDFIYEF